jgi:hypothetical protein
MLIGFQPAQAGSYAVIVRNSSGSVTSLVAVLTDIPVLNRSLGGNELVLDWTGTFILQTATNAAGPYFDLPLGYMPFTNLIDPAEPQRFFRLRSPAAVLGSAVTSNGAMAVTIVGAAGHNYLIQASSNLLDWTTVQTSPSPIVFEDTNAPAFPIRFYRAMLAE